MYRKYIKRMADVLLCVLGLAACAVPMAAIAAAVRLDSQGPALFRQERLGKGEKPFVIYKFRTMCDHAYEMGGIASRSDDPRITRVGAFLRRTSLDELPQMFNILRGDMSIIGPRPILPWEFDGYRDNPRYRRRHDIAPGLFCTVDVFLRAAATRQEQFEMDAEYVDNVSFCLDARTFFGVLGTVLSGRNVYREEADDRNRR